MFFYYSYGILLSIISFVFYIIYAANAPIYQSAFYRLVKLVFSLSLAWLLILLMGGDISRDFSFHFLWKVIFVLGPLIFFVSLQVLLYHDHDKEKE